MEEPIKFGGGHWTCEKCGKIISGSSIVHDCRPHKNGRVTNLPKNPRAIWDEAIALGSENWVDEKGTADNPGHWQRQPSKLTFEEAFDLIQPFKPHWTCYFRDVSYVTSGRDEDYWDFGGCNIGENRYGDVFIWIKVKLEIAEQIFKKFDLQVEWY
jgi:hypothetical protein